MNTIRLLVVLALCSLITGRLEARQTPTTKFVLNVDYARFQYDQQSCYLEIYYGFYPKLVTMQQRGGMFSGAVILKTTLLNATTNAVLQSEHSLLPVTLADTSSTERAGNFLTQAGYALPFGEYRLHVTATDSLDPTRGDSLDVPISINPFGEAIAVSDIELCSEIKSSQDKSNAFYKNSLEVIPNASLLYGVTGYPVIFHYVELYNLDVGKKYTLRVQLVDPTEQIVRDASRERTYGVENSVDVSTVNITSLASGKYNFLFTVFDGGDNIVARVQKSFYIYNPHIQVAEATPAQIKAGELSGLSSDEMAEEFRQAQYVATSEDSKTFSNLTNEEGRREFLAKFWVEVEKGKPGKSPIRRSDYLRRVTVANQRFKNQGREGWASDRGRVFILFGEPDEIERVASQNNAKPHEIWHYYQVENGVMFVFVDRSGFSDYALVHSTKRGELQDESWQRYLQ